MAVTCVHMVVDGFDLSNPGVVAQIQDGSLPEISSETLKVFQAINDELRREAIVSHRDNDRLNVKIDTQNNYLYFGVSQSDGEPPVYSETGSLDTFASWYLLKAAIQVKREAKAEGADFVGFDEDNVVKMSENAVYKRLGVQPIAARAVACILRDHYDHKYSELNVQDIPMQYTIPDDARPSYASVPEA